MRGVCSPGMKGSLFLRPYLFLCLFQPAIQHCLTQIPIFHRQVCLLLYAMNPVFCWQSHLIRVLSDTTNPYLSLPSLPSSISVSGHQPRYAEPTLIYCWFTVCDAGQILNQHLVNIPCLLKSLSSSIHSHHPLSLPSAVC